MNKAFYDSSFKVGILGGGQLGRMFIQEAINLNVQVCILDPDPEAPCKNLVSEFVCGSLTDYDAVIAFGQDKDVITIEIEHVNVDALLQLEKSGKKVFPSPALLQMVQDKGLQKEFYTKNNIPTAPFHLIENKAAIHNYRNEFPFFQKLRKGGYDGRGVIALNDPEKIENAFDEPSVLEKKIPFVKELSVIVSRNEKGETSVFPVVEAEFNPHVNLVEFLFSPAQISASIERRAREIALMVADRANLTGILAVEMFLLEDETIYVNEIAPRPHNSGHHTIEANITSQYEQHLRAILNLPPGDTSTIKPAVMVNLLGEEGYSGAAHYEGMDEALALPGVYVHLYGKKETRPYRKMGHVTILADNIADALGKAQKIKQRLKIKSK
jgi:5-(carboxyamino)imidazole ribonucleotide synthase